MGRGMGEIIAKGPIIVHCVCRRRLRSSVVVSDAAAKEVAALVFPIDEFSFMSPSDSRSRLFAEHNVDGRIVVQVLCGKDTVEGRAR